MVGAFGLWEPRLCSHALVATTTVSRHGVYRTRPALRDLLTLLWPCKACECARQMYQGGMWDDTPGYKGASSNLGDVVG